MTLSRRLFVCFAYVKNCRSRRLKTFNSRWNIAAYRLLLKPLKDNDFYFGKRWGRSGTKINRDVLARSILTCFSCRGVRLNKYKMYHTIHVPTSSLKKVLYIVHVLQCHLNKLRIKKILAAFDKITFHWSVQHVL